MIIGLAGKKQSGKNTLAYYLCDTLGFEEDSFGAPIRRFVAELCGYTREELELYKEEVHPLLGATPRHMMQTLSTEWARDTIKSSIWIDCLASRLRDADRVVISDLRFENEATAIRQMGGTIVHIFRQSDDDVDTHASEAGVAVSTPPDYVLYNNGDVATFLGNAKTMVQQINGERK